MAHERLSLFADLSAMALEMPDVPDHPNAIPFKGIMTRLDEPSDLPVGGAKGCRVLIPTDIAEKALPSLLGMAVNFAPNLSGHDPTRVVGVITEAWIEGNAIWIKGILYGANFPKVVAEIKAKKDRLGFSYESHSTVDSWKGPVATVTYCVFTGAAILFKDKAAYQTTSLEASASQETEQMTPEEIAALVASAVTAAITPLNEQITALQAGNDVLHANAEVHAKVKPHADRLRAAADTMKASGYGLHPENGHVKILHHMADKMEAEGVMGKLPHVYRDHDFLTASADPNGNPELITARGEIANLTAQLAESKAQLFASADSPERKAALALQASKEGGGETVNVMRVRMRAEGKSGREIGVAVTERLMAEGLPTA